MADWLKNNVFVIIALLTILVGGAVAHGQMTEQVKGLKDDVDELHEDLIRIEARQIEMLDRLAHLEGRTSAKGELP